MTVRSRRMRVLPLLAFLPLPALLVPRPARALEIVPGTLVIERSVDGGATWPIAIPCTGTSTVYKGDQLRISMTLRNNTNWMGNLWGDYSTVSWPCGFDPAYICPPNPGDPQNANVFVGDANQTGDPLQNIWSGQLWIWPTLGVPSCAPSPPADDACATPGNLPYPARGNSPVSFVSGMSVTTFDYNGEHLASVEEYDPAGPVWTPKAPMPTGRSGLVVISDGSVTLYAIGGRNDSGYSAAVESYDPGSDTWTAGLAALPTPREHMAAATLNGTIYVIGGRDATGVLADVRAYDVAADAWIPMGTLTTPRYGAMAAVSSFDGRLYVYGGLDASGIPISTIEVFDGVSAWTVENDSTGSGLEGRSFCAVMSDPATGRLHFVGGYAGDGMLGGTGMHSDVIVYDPTGGSPGVFYPITPIPGPNGLGRGYFSMGTDGAGFWFATGGRWGDPTPYMNYRPLPEPTMFGWGNGEDLVYEPATDTWSLMAVSMNARRYNHGVAGSGGKVYAIGGHTGPRGTLDAEPPPPVAEQDVSRVSFVFRAEYSWPALDFSVIGFEKDDAYSHPTFNYGFGSISEGAYLDCGSCSWVPDSMTGLQTNRDIFATNCGGTIVIKSPFDATIASAPVAGTRPPETVYIGDAFQLIATTFNNGGSATIMSGDACTDFTFAAGSTVCVFKDFGLQGTCAPGVRNPTSPALPFVHPPLAPGSFVWTYSVAGQGGVDACGAAGVGSGTLYFTTNLYGAPLFATVYVVPPPLSIAATVFVDPDGVSSTTYGWYALRSNAGVAESYYNQGAEDLRVSFIYTNTSSVYSFDIAPTLTAGTYDADLLKSAPIVTGSLLLAPDASTTVSWVVSRNPAGGLLGCQPPGDPIGIIGFRTVIRGLEYGADVALRDNPFRPSPFDPLDDCPGGCTAGTRNLTFAVPSTQAVNDIFNATLTAKSTADRPFVLDPSATLWMEPLNYAGSVTMTGQPLPGAVAWTPGQSVTFTWTFTALASGKVCFNAGIDFFSGSAPCHRACRTGASYCAPRSPPLDLITPDYTGCELLILVPGILQVGSFLATPGASCDEGGQIVTVAVTIRNTSSVFCAVLDPNAICNGAPDGYAAGQPALGSYASLLSGPDPVFPQTIPAGGQLTVSFYMDAVCPVPSGGLLEFGCFSPKTLVTGKAVDCVFPAIVVNPSDVPSWTPAAPVQITSPAALWCSAWTDNDRYSVGQTITVSMTLENQGGDDLTAFTAAVSAKGSLGGAVAPLIGPVPPLPVTYTGTGVCMPDAAFPPFPSSQTFQWTFTALSRGKITFTSSAGGWDNECGNLKFTSCQMPEIVIADEAKLSVSAYASGLVTMSVSCTGCPPQSGCDPNSGVGCIDVTLNASNFGGVDVSCFEVPDGLPANLFEPCPGCGGSATSFGMPGFACNPPSATDRCGDCVPCAAQGCDGAPGCQPAAPAAPPACSATAMWNPSALPECPGTVLLSGDTRSYRWRFAPAGLGCFRAKAWARGNDDATCEPLFAVDGLPVGVLEGQGTTNCIQVKARYPLELSLVSAPAQIAPGQEFIVQVRVCNPGDTAGGLQGGEPALQFYEIGTGAKITEQYDVIPPPPVILASGACQVIDVRVVAHKNAASGGVEIRVPQGALFIATDAETGLPFAARDTGAALLVTVINPANRFVVVGDNQTRILQQPVVFSYQVADAGGSGGRTTLKIYTLSGELVRTLVDKPAAVEDVTVAWDGKNADGQTVAGGVYLARLEAPSMKDGKVVKVPILK